MKKAIVIGWRLIWIPPVVALGCLFVASVAAMHGPKEAKRLWRDIW